MRTRRLVPLLALVLAACGGGVATGTPTPAPGASGTPSASLVPTPTPTAAPTATATATATATPTPTSTAPASCLPLRGGANSLAAVRDVRTGVHPGFDRLVVEFNGPVPTWTMAANGSMVFSGGGRGEPVTLAGSYGVRLDFQHVDWTHGVYPHGMDLVPGSTTLREVRVVGNFEGVVNIGIGLARQVCPSVTELSGPPRLVVDFPTA